MEMSENNVHHRDFLEIDMVEIFREIGRQKKVIIVLMFAFALIGTVYTLLSKDVWSSGVRLIRPSLVDLGDGVLIGGSLSVSQEKGKAETIRYSPIQGNLPLPQFVFNQFYMYLTSDDARFSVDGKEELFLYRNVRIVKYDDVVDVQLKNETKEKSEADLQRFLVNVNVKFMKQYLSESIIALKEEIRRTEMYLQSQIEFERETLSMALKLAKRARIQEPRSVQVEENPVLSYAALGEGLLSGGLALLDETKDIFAGARLKKLKSELALMESVQNRGVQGTAFAIQIGKNIKAINEKGKVLNVIAFGLAAGLVFGVLYSVCILVWRRYQNI